MISGLTWEPRILLLKRYSASFSYRLEEMGSFGIGVQNIMIGNGYLNAGLTYNTPIRSKVIYTSTVEISLGYFIRKKQIKRRLLFHPVVVIIEYTSKINL